MKTVIIDGKKYTFFKAHKHLWNWLVENPGKTKEDYFKLHDVSIVPRKLCFACKYCHEHCESCPITKWRNCSSELGQHSICVGYVDECEDYIRGLFGEYEDLMGCKHFNDACIIARKIANLEWKEV